MASPERQSITATYDSRKTGPRYHVTSRIDDSDRDVVEDVLELDDNYLGPGDSSRRREFNAALSRDMVRFVDDV